MNTVYIIINETGRWYDEHGHWTNEPSKAKEFSTFYDMKHEIAVACFNGDMSSVTIVGHNDVTGVPRYRQSQDQIILEFGVVISG